MAVTAKFQADFSSFDKAVKEAEIELRSFESGAGKVEKALSNMVDRFSGRRAIQEAGLIERAVQEVGGISALTEKELQTLGAKATEAIEKMKKIGVVVPPGLQNVADAAKTADARLSGMIGTVGELAGAFGIAFSAGALVQFGRDVLGAGDAIQKMSDQTGMTTEEVQRLKYVTGQAGVSMETMVSAAQNLQQRLGDDNSGAAAAMNRLKINAEAFGKLSTYQQVLQLSDSLRKEADVNQRASDGAAIFGKTWKEVGPAITSNMKDIGDQAPVMADATVKGLDRIGDSLRRAKEQGIAWGGSLALQFEQVGFSVGDFLSTFNPSHWGVANSQLLALQVNGAKLDAAFKHLQPPVAAVTGALGPLKLTAKQTADIEKELNEKINESIPINKAAADAWKKAVEQMKAFAGIRDLGDNFTSLGQPRVIKEITQNFDDLIRTGVHINDLGQDFSALGKGIDEARLKSSAFTIAFRAGDVGVQQAAEDVKEVNHTFADLAGILDNISGAFAETAAIGLRLGQALVNDIGHPLKMVMDIATAATAVIAKFWNKLTGAESRRVNDLRDDFVTAAGGLGKLNEQAVRAGLTLDHFLKVDNVKAYTAEVERLQKAFDFQSQALDELADDEEKYHLSLNKSSADLFRAYTILTSTGRSGDVVLGAMKEDFEALVLNALKFGIALPSAMKPLIQRMIDLGLLTDDTGKKLDDISQLDFTDAGSSGETAFDRMREGSDKFVAAIKLFMKQELTELERRLLGLPALIDPFRPGSAGQPGGGTGRNPGGGAEPPTTSLTPATAARVFQIGAGGVVQHTSVLNVDGKELTRVVTLHQLDKRRNNVKSKAA